MTYTVTVVYTCDGSHDDCYGDVTLTPTNQRTSNDTLRRYGWVVEFDLNTSPISELHFCPACQDKGSTQ